MDGKGANTTPAGSCVPGLSVNLERLPVSSLVSPLFLVLGGDLELDEEGVRRRRRSRERDLDNLYQLKY